MKRSLLAAHMADLNIDTVSSDNASQLSSDWFNPHDYGCDGRQRSSEPSPNLNKYDLRKGNKNGLLQPVTLAEHLADLNIYTVSSDNASHMSSDWFNPQEYGSDGRQRSSEQCPVGGDTQKWTYNKLRL